MKNIVRFKYTSIILLLTLTVACHKRAPVMAPTSEAPAPVPPPPPAPTCVLTGEPATIEQGHSVTLSWTTKDATEVDVAPGLGKQLAQGSTSVTPSVSTTYILSATGPGGNATCTARVTVSASAASSVKEENINAEGLASQLKDAFFDYDSADLRPDAQEVLSADAGLLKANPDLKVIIEGHCDQRGSEEYNLGLGQKRADAARGFLVNLGVAASQLSTITYGKSRLFCPDNTDACWQQNRRAHLVLK